MVVQNFKFIFEIIVSVVLVIVFAVWISNFIKIETGFMNQLGFLPSTPCRISLSLTSSGTDKCMVKGFLLASDCYGKKYQMREDDCSGSLLYEDRIIYDNFKSTFGWFTQKGTHKYVLCMDNVMKDSVSLTCE